MPTARATAIVQATLVESTTFQYIHSYPVEGLPEALNKRINSKLELVSSTTSQPHREEFKKALKNLKNHFSNDLKGFEKFKSDLIQTTVSGIRQDTPARQRVSRVLTEIGLSLSSRYSVYSHFSNNFHYTDHFLFLRCFNDCNEQRNLFPNPDHWDTTDTVEEIFKYLQPEASDDASKWMPSPGLFESTVAVELPQDLSKRIDKKLHGLSDDLKKEFRQNLLELKEKFSSNPKYFEEFKSQLILILNHSLTNHFDLLLNLVTSYSTEAKSLLMVEFFLLCNEQRNLLPNLSHRHTTNTMEEIFKYLQPEPIIYAELVVTEPIFAEPVVYAEPVVTEPIFAEPIVYAESVAQKGPVVQLPQQGTVQYFEELLGDLSPKIDKKLDGLDEKGRNNFKENLPRLKAWFSEHPERFEDFELAFIQIARNFTLEYLDLLLNFVQQSGGTNSRILLLLRNLLLCNKQRNLLPNLNHRHTTDTVEEIFKYLCPIDIEAVPGILTGEHINIHAKNSELQAADAKKVIEDLLKMVTEDEKKRWKIDGNSAAYSLVSNIENVMCNRKNRSLFLSTLKEYVFKFSEASKMKKKDDAEAKDFLNTLSSSMGALEFWIPAEGMGILQMYRGAEITINLMGEDSFQDRKSFQTTRPGRPS